MKREIILGFILIFGLITSSFCPQEARNCGTDYWNCPSNEKCDSSCQNKCQHSGGCKSSKINDPAAQEYVANIYGKLPLTFVENKGQYDKQVKFCARSPKATVYFTSTELLFHFAEKKKEPVNLKALERPEPDGPKSDVGGKHRELVLRLSFLGSNPSVLIGGQEELPGKVNVFKGKDSSKWVTDIPTYKKVIYHNLWEGIDLVYYGMPECGMKYDFVVRPGADPATIKLRYAGQDKLTVNSEGELVIDTAFGPIVEKKPYIYQQINGKDKDIKGTFSLNNNTISLNIGDYDKNYQLMIDPELAYSTFVGGTSRDEAFDIAVDSSGCSYITGHTMSDDFPTTIGAFDTSPNGDYDVFVTKLNASGTGLVYSTYIGGIIGDQPLAFSLAFAITVDSYGCAYVTGYTDVSDFPVTVGAFDTSYNGGGADPFITKLNASGSGLVYSTYFGGKWYDYGREICVDSSGCAYITGETSPGDFPVTAGAFDTTPNEGIDAYITKFDASGSALVYSTFLGGKSDDYGYSICIDPYNRAYVTGITDSEDFPVSDAFDKTYNGNDDVFVTKLNASGSALIYSTFLGGTEFDFGWDLSLDTFECAYITGYTLSTDFPTTTGAYDITHSGNYDTFITKLDVSGAGLEYSTFLGGSERDLGRSISVGSPGCACVTGSTESADFPIAGAFDDSYSGNEDVFITTLNALGTGLVYSTFLGGTDNIDWGYGVSLDSFNCAYATGFTRSADFPATAGAFDTSHNGSGDAFVTKIQIRPYIYSITYSGSTATIYWYALKDMPYVVEWSKDMLLWEEVYVGRVDNWADIDAGGYEVKFYRVRVE